MKTYKQPQMQIVALQSAQMNCQFVQILSAGGAFNIGDPIPSDEQL